MAESVLLVDEIIWLGQSWIILACLVVNVKLVSKGWVHM